MKKIISNFALFSSALIPASPAFAKSNALPKLTPCYATRLVEMRNSVLAAHLLCRAVIDDSTYEWFLETNRERVSQANKVAIAGYLKHSGSRKLFDDLDSRTMNGVALVASKNPSYFCTQTAVELRKLATTMPIDQLLKEQTLLEIPACPL